MPCAAGGAGLSQRADAGCALLLQVVSHQTNVPGIDFRTIAISVLIYLGAPLVAAIITRYALIALAGRRWFDKRFMPYFGPVALLALVYTVRPNPMSNP